MNITQIERKEERMKNQRVSSTTSTVFVNIIHFNRKYIICAWTLQTNFDTYFRFKWISFFVWMHADLWVKSWTNQPVNHSTTNWRGMVVVVMGEYGNILIEFTIAIVLLFVSVLSILIYVRGRFQWFLNIFVYFYSLNPLLRGNRDYNSVEFWSNFMWKFSIALWMRVCFLSLAKSIETDLYARRKIDDSLVTVPFGQKWHKANVWWRQSNQINKSELNLFGDVSHNRYRWIAKWQIVSLSFFLSLCRFCSTTKIVMCYLHSIDSIGA